MNVPAVISRQQWGALPFRGRVQSLGQVRHVVVHHAAGFRAVTAAEATRQILAIQALHQGPKRNWSDIGYHFVINAGGSIFQGRPYYAGASLADLPKLAVGAHVLNMNTGKVGICLLGCFHPAQSGCNDTPTASALASLEALVRYLCAHYGVTAGQLKTHRDFLDTECPGDTLWNAVADVRSRIDSDH